MPFNDDAVIEPSKAFLYYAPVGSVAPTLETLQDFDPDQPDSLGGGTAEVQTVTITGTPTGGTFTLTFKSQTTAGIAYNASSAAVQSALVALSTIGAGDVTVAGGPGPATPWTVTFGGTLADQDVPAMTASATGLTGGTTPAVNVATSTPGVSLMPGWRHAGHTDLDDDFNADEDGGDSDVRGTRQVPNLRETVEPVTEYVEINLVQFDADSLSLYYGGGTPGDGTYDSVDSPSGVDYATFIVYVDGSTRRVAEYHPRTSIRRNGPINREADGFLKMPIRLTPLKLAGQPVTRWFGETFTA